MTGEEIKEIITKNGFHPIPVSPYDSDVSKQPRFDGTLDEFWAAAKALEAKAIFLAVTTTDESDFERSPPSDDPHEDEDSQDRIVLEEYVPSISKFRKYIGKDCAFVLIAKGGFADVDILVTEDWWDEFNEEAEKALDLYEEERSREAEKDEAEADKRRTELLASLRELIKDREFCLLKTQRAMLAYAIEKIPELEELDQYILKPEVQTLHARIEARGLNKR